MKKQLLTLLIMAGATCSFAQKAAVYGHIANQKNEAVPFAALALHQLPDSTLVKADIADESGDFVFRDLRNGAYFLRATAVGLAAFRSDTFSLSGADVRLSAFQMLPATQQLQEVTVKAAKPLIEVAHDKMIFNVEGSVNSTGNTALELLQKAPGVQVDKDENVLVKGKTGVRIYIDGRPSQLAGKDLASVLKSMNSADIEAVEIITNPSAKYEAAGDLGIINIRLKKNRKIGTNGNVSAGVNFGITPKYNASLNLNHRGKKINVFGTYGHNQGAWHNRTYDDQILNNIAYLKLWNGIYRDTSHNARIGADYFINSKHTIGINLNGRFSHQNGGGESTTRIVPVANLDADSVILRSQTSNPTKSNNVNYNLNYRYADTTGHELNADVDYGRYLSKGLSYQPNRYIFGSGEQQDIVRNYVTRTPVEIQIKSFKVDYEQPLFKGRLGYGTKLSDVQSDNTFDFFTVENGEETRDIDRSNRFKYTERVYALYVNYNRSLSKKWDLQFGLRGEQTHSLGNLISYKEMPLNKVDTSYFSLFPSGALTYKAHKDHSFNLNYSRRINRPNYQNLNPFEYRIDELVYSRGNPFLKPEYANVLKLSHVYKSKLTTSLGYNRTRFPVVGLRIPYDSSRTYFITQNLDYSQSFSLDLSLSTEITSWWNLYFNFSGYHNLWRAQLDNGLIVNNRTTAFNLNGQNTFKLKNNWTIELSGWYNSPYRRIDYNWQMGMVDIGVQRKFWKDNATVKATFSDVFHTARGGYTSAYAGIETRLRFRFEGQMLKLSFNYRFGSNEIKAARNRRSGNEEEQNRIR